MTTRPAARAGPITSAACWARSAAYSRASVRGSISAWDESRRMSRIFAPIGVAPGSRVTTGSAPASVSQAARRSIWVDLPAPSIPSTTRNSGHIPVLARGGRGFLGLAGLPGVRILRVAAGGIVAAAVELAALAHPLDQLGGLDALRLALLAGLLGALGARVAGAGAGLFLDVLALGVRRAADERTEAALALCERVAAVRALLVQELRDLPILARHGEGLLAVRIVRAAEELPALAELDHHW